MAHEDMACFHQVVHQVGALETRRELEETLVVSVKVGRDVKRFAQQFL